MILQMFIGQTTVSRGEAGWQESLSCYSSASSRPSPPSSPSSSPASTGSSTSTTRVAPQELTVTLYAASLAIIWCKWHTWRTNSGSSASSQSRAATTSSWMSVSRELALSNAFVSKIQRLVSSTTSISQMESRSQLSYALRVSHSWEVYSALIIWSRSPTLALSSYSVCFIEISTSS